MTETLDWKTRFEGCSSDLRNRASEIAGWWPQAGEYIALCPSIVLASYVEDWGSHTISRERARWRRLNYFGQMMEFCRRRAPLREVMAGFGLPKVARQLDFVGQSFGNPGKLYSIVADYGRRTPSEFSQALRRWGSARVKLLLWTKFFGESMPQGQHYEDWALRYFPAGLSEGVLTHLIDFIIDRNGRAGQVGPFLLPNSWTQAESVLANWDKTHDAIEGKIKDVVRGGQNPDEVFSYAPLPSTFDIRLQTVKLEPLSAVIPKGDAYEKTIETEEVVLTFVALDTPRKLIEEGARMRHCVGSYWLDVKQGSSIIYGIRDGSGKRLSTVEYFVHGSTLKQKQHKAFANAAPTAGAAKAAQIFAEQMTATHRTTLKPSAASDNRLMEHQREILRNADYRLRYGARDALGQRAQAEQQRMEAERQANILGRRANMWIVDESNNWGEGPALTYDGLRAMSEQVRQEAERPRPIQPQNPWRVSGRSRRSWFDDI